jgi:hypothetical protein
MHPDRMHADELALELRLSILEEHSDDLLKVAAELVQGLSAIITIEFTPRSRT